MKRFAVALSCSLAAVLPACAQDGGGDSPLAGSLGVRALGMGGAVSAWLDEPAALWWNPTTLLHVPVRRLELQHTKNIFDTRTESFALATPTLDHGTWAVGGALQTTTDITITGASSPVPLGTEDFNRFQLGAGYGFGLPRHLAAGFALTVAGYRFMGIQRVAWGLDVGLSPYASGIVSTSVVVKNLLRPTYSFEGGIEDQWARRLVAAAGLAKSGFTASLELEFSDRQDSRFRAGAEYEVAEPLALRAGYDGLGPAAGASFRYRGFRVDYAFVSPSELGSEHRLGLSIDLGRPIAEQRRLREERLSHEVATALDRQRTSQRPGLESQAQRALAAGDFGNATTAYAQLSFLYPDEGDYLKGLEEVSRQQDSAVAAQIEEATRKATSADRAGLLDSLAKTQMLAGHYVAAVATAGRLAAEPSRPPEALSLLQAASDSLAARTAAALTAARQALADTVLVEAAGQAQLALFYAPDNAEATRLLAEIRLSSARQLWERALLGAAALGDSQTVFSTADSLLAHFPLHDLARDYRARFTPQAQTVGIETIQADTEAWEWYTRAFGAFREGRHKEAITWWEKVLARYPTNQDTRKNLEQARLRLNSDRQD